MPTSKQIPIIGAHIPFLRLLVFRQPQIRASTIPVPILHQNADRICDTARSTQACKRNTYTIPRLESWRILGEKGIRGNDTTNIAEADLPSRSYGTAMVAAKVHVEPADDDWHSAVCTHGDEEERGILELVVVVDGDEDAEAGDTDADWDYGECEAVFCEIGKCGDDHGEGEGAGPWGNAM